MVIVVIDGQGGGIGAAVIKGLRESLGQEQEILALGTNSSATSKMMKAGANRGATGENAVVQTCSIADVILGPLAIILANSMMGEVTPAISAAISTCRAQKILIPLTQENVTIVGAASEPLPHMVRSAVSMLKEVLK